MIAYQYAPPHVAAAPLFSPAVGHPQPSAQHLSQARAGYHLPQKKAPAGTTRGPNPPRYPRPELRSNLESFPLLSCSCSQLRPIRSLAQAIHPLCIPSPSFSCSFNQPSLFLSPCRLSKCRIRISLRGGACACADDVLTTRLLRLTDLSAS